MNEIGIYITETGIEITANNNVAVDDSQTCILFWQCNCLAPIIYPIDKPYCKHCKSYQGDCLSPTIKEVKANIKLLSLVAKKAISNMRRRNEQPS